MIVELFLQLDAIKNHAAESVGTATIVSAVYSAFKLWDHNKGRGRDQRQRKQLEEIKDDLKLLKWHVTGPDNNGGLMKDVRTIQEDFHHMRLDIARLLPPDDIPARGNDPRKRRDQ